MIRFSFQNWLRQVFNSSCQLPHRKLLAFLPRIEVLEDREVPAVFLVTSTGNGTGSLTDGTLRAAILNSNITPGPDTIEFDIEPTNGINSFNFIGQAKITLTTPLPTIADTVTVDGTSQPGWDGNSHLDEVVIDGNNLEGNVLTVTANNCEIEGVICTNSLSDGLAIYSNMNIIIGDAFSNNEGNGIELAGDASDNRVGTTTSVYGNSFDSNKGAGLFVDANSSNNVIQNNSSLSNTSDGIEVQGSGNTIGGTTFGAGNVIGSNGGAGIDVSGTGNLIQGNLIGTDATGTSVVANVRDGIELLASNNTIGGTVAGAGNIISGNNQWQIIITNTSNNDLIEGNLIGTDITGTIAIPNTSEGIVDEGSGTTIGGTVAGAGNLISGNEGAGIFLVTSSASNTQIVGNRIGTNLAGTAAIPNQDGILLSGASNNTIGGTTAGAGNVIAYNSDNGIQLEGDASPTNNDSIRGNSIFANADLGIALDQANKNQAAPSFSGPSVFAPTTKKLTGTIDIPNTSTPVAFTVDFYANPNPAPPIGTQGEVYIGSQTITSKAGTSGTTAFPFSITITTTAFSTSATPLITATITDPSGNTSAFSNTSVDPVLATPAITSPKTAAFTVNTPGNFAVTTSGFPTPILTLSGILPKGLSFNPATGVISGLPAAGTSGVHILHFTAKNGIGLAATQTFTLTINKFVKQLDVPAQVTVIAPTKVTALGHDQFEATFTLTENPSSPVAGQLRIAGFTNLPTGVTFDSSTSAAFPAKTKKLTLTLVFTNATTISLATLLAGLSPIVDEIIA